MFREDKQLRDLLHSSDFVYCESQRKALPSNFADIVAYYIENLGISTRIIADRCCLSNGVISKCKTNHNYKPDIPIVAAFSLGIGLMPGLNDHIMHRVGHFLDGETDQEIVYDILLSTMYADDIVAWNDFMVSEELPPLIREKQTGVK